jgi:uncharacterized protein (TIGR03437 family)
LTAPLVQLSAVTNAASYQTGVVSPGEIVTLFGGGMGPATLATLQLNPDQTGITSSLAGTRVLFNAIPAPLIYTLDRQVSAIVPYAVAGQTQVSVRVEYQGQQSAPLTVAVDAAAPALFTLDQSGKGPAAILNQDYTVNTAQNPAGAGSAIMIFATGEGVTSPAGVDGKLADPAALGLPVLPVAVRIGGLDAQVLYAGNAPTLVTGLFQVNAAIPPGLPAGAASIVLTVGGRSSPAGVTVAVK